MYSYTILFYVSLLCLLGACANQTPTATVSPNHAQQGRPTTATSTPAALGLAISLPKKPATHKIASHPHPTPTPAPLATTPTPVPTQIVTVQATQPPTGTVSGGAQTAQEQQLVQQLYALINQDRANVGLPALAWSPILAGTAYQHSVLMVNGCGIAHQCAGEATPCQRIANAGINDPACGENIGNAAATPTLWAGVQQIDVGMLNEPEPAFHRRNILSATHHHVGIGIIISATYQTWITEDFTDV
jgi:uncharacterized protein YkwD